MRFGFIFALVVLVATPGLATAGTVVSGFNCSQILPCNQSDPAFPTVQNLITYSESCVHQNMPIPVGVNVFDPAAGLDTNGNLTTNPDAFPAVGAVPTTASCGIHAMAGGRCVVHCDIVTQ
jgi:hypothetical protein